MPRHGTGRTALISSVCCSTLLSFALAATSSAGVVEPSSANPAPEGFSTPTSLPQAHAHNDYLHPTPLWDALAQGFTSIEADIWFEDGQLLLGHTQPEATTGPQAGRSLEDWYLKPLAEWVRGTGGQVYPDRTEPVRLLVDVKDGGADTLARTEELLASYSDVLTHVEDGQLTPGAVQVVYSGEPPFETIADRPVRYGFYDGRESDLTGTDALDARDMPLVSSTWTDVIGDPTGFVERADGHGADSRVWGVPETDPVGKRATWAAQLRAGLDVIGTDDLVGLREFLVGLPD
ncbi:MAG: hypothetical protein ACTH1D_08745 [Mycobacteriaceae bacterium]|uniref:hypothetical protein n=1 Tax=Corynebacterium sp. TaxID=1720 RepID=UPI003F94AA1B